MLKTITISDIGTKGINTDLPPWSLPPEFITDGINFSINTNTISGVRPLVKQSSPPSDVSAGYLVFLKSGDANTWLYCGDNIYTTDSVTWTDVSSGSYASQDRNAWSGGMLGKLAIVNNPEYTPEYIDPTAVTPAMTALQWDVSNTWSVAGYSCKVIRPYKNFLIALGPTEAGTYYPDAYRWSHPADTNGLPPSWDETDTAFLAGRAQLGGDGGEIVDGLQLRDSFVIYSKSSIDILDFTGDEFVFRRRSLSNSYGLVAQNAVVEVEGLHYFLADGDIVYTDGNDVKSAVYRKFKKRLASNMNVDNYHKSYAFKDEATRTIGFVVPEGTSTEPNIAYLYNYSEGTWTIREFGPTIFAAFGQLEYTEKTWGNTTSTWVDPDFAWGSNVDTPLNSLVMAIDSSNSDLVVPKNSLSGTSAYVERLGMALEGHDNVTTITRIYPHISGTQELQIQVGSQDKAGGAVRWKASQAFRPGVDRKIDVRTTGELHCWRITAEDSGSWEFSGMTVEYVPAGKR